METTVAIITAIVGGVPKLIEMIRAGADPSQIKLSDFISTDALAKLEKAKTDAEDFIQNG